MMMKKNKVNITVHSSLCCWLYLKRTCYMVFLYTDLEAWYHRSHTELKGKSIKVFQCVRRQQHAWTISPDADGLSPKGVSCVLLLRCFWAPRRRNSRSEVQGGQQYLRKCLSLQTRQKGSHLKNHGEPLSPLKGKHTFWKSCWNSSPKTELRY